MPLNFETKHPQGFTRIDWMIGGIIAIIVTVIALHNLLENPKSRQIRKPATRNLRAFAHGNQLDALNCEGNDADGDGWVLCEAKNRQGQLVTLQCGYDQRQSDCRPQPMGNQE